MLSVLTKLFLILSIGLFSSCSFHSDSRNGQREHEWVEIPIAEYTPSQLPCLGVRIERNNYRLVLDLGNSGDLSLHKSLVDHLSAKEFTRVKTTFGFRGKQYHKRCFRIPNVEIGKIVFHVPLLEEGSEESDQDSILSEGISSLRADVGEIGWRLFCTKKVLFDLGNSKIIIVKDADILSKHGYPIELFAKTALLTDRGFLECELELDTKPLRCLLDTSCTGNLVHKNFGDGETFEQIIKNPKNIHRYTSLKIDGKIFGPVDFYDFPLHSSIELDAVLGMDFFTEHVVFIDFPENQRLEKSLIIRQV